ncbi:MAG: HAMP domain-containing histidine kinase [Clostridiales bacterium]|jgi:signal transduction histidine kinase|nr:HAMP domain-containing histidine kinase [Clostridiales bacterium]
MIKRLRIKIIAVVVGTLALVFAAVLLALNITVSRTSISRTEDFMRQVAENGGFFLPPREPMEGRFGGMPDMNMRGPFPENEIMRAGRFFYAKLGEDGAVIELNVDMMFDFNEGNAQGYISAVLDGGREKGEIGEFYYLSAEKTYGRILVFAERSIEIGIIDDLTRLSLWVAGIAGLVLIGIAAFLARWMVEPVRTALDKQRRFISDAGHELKTPLTIIGANAELLGNEIGGNKRIAHITSQLGMMNALVGDLLALAKMDETAPKRVHSEFDLSGAVLNAALEFEEAAFEEGKEYSYGIAEDIGYTGDENQIKQLVAILIDNAIKHSDKNGKVKISLTKEGSCPRISVYNTGAGIADKERGRVFERFYRSDESRARETGGYGIGLSIAKMIADAHKASIGISGEYGKWVRFDVIL